MEKDTPTYDLTWIKHKLDTGRYWIERLASRGAMALGFDEDDILTCVRQLSPADFHKSMESETMPGLWQDVYKPVYLGVGIYLKLQIARTPEAVVIQFKKDESHGR